MRGLLQALRIFCPLCRHTHTRLCALDVDGFHCAYQGFEHLSGWNLVSLPFFIMNMQLDTVVPLETHLVSGRSGQVITYGHFVRTQKHLSKWGWQSPGPGCPGRLWSLLWGYSRPAWTRSCAACSGWPCFSRGLDWVTHRGPCQPRTFCDSVNGFVPGSALALQ